MMEKERERTPAPLKKKNERNPGENGNEKELKREVFRQSLGGIKL